jgi:hypothetical protein
MHSRTIATLDRLEKASWFSRVGMNEESGVAVLRSWSEAIHHCAPGVSRQRPNLPRELLPSAPRKD